MIPGDVIVCLTWIIQATVDAKRKEIELLKLQTALVLVGDGVHREILDHFAPWIVNCYRRALHWSQLPRTGRE